MQPGQLQRGTELRLVAEEPAFSSTGGSAHGGEGMTIARHEGFVIFVVGAVPGDEVMAEVVRVKKNFAEARVTRLEKPSRLRTEPRCRHFGVCGGCKWQHVEYQSQLRFKERFVKDSLERIGGFKDPVMLPIIGAEDVFFYRNKMEFSFSDQMWFERIPEQSDSLTDKPEIFLGLHVPQRYDKILEIEECHLQSEESNRILNFTRQFFRGKNVPVYSSKTHSGFLRFLVMRQSRRSHELMVNLVTFEDRPELMELFSDELRKEVPEVTTIVNTVNTRRAQIAYGEVEKVYYGPGIIREKFLDFTFSVSAGSFFQTNTAQAERLFRVAFEMANLKHDETVYDLYSGTGTIAICISRDVKQVIGLESSESAVRDAERNAVENGVSNCRFIHGDMSAKLLDSGWQSEHPSPGVVITDPPRSGMHPKVVESLMKISPPRLVYVSCNPATQARDLQSLCRGKYDLVKSQPVDMFPHTYHVENISLLKVRA